MNRELFNQMLAALESTITSDGCFPGCGRKQNSDVAHSFRCTRVAAAIGAAKAERRAMSVARAKHGGKQQGR